MSETRSHSKEGRRLQRLAEAPTRSAHPSAGRQEAPCKPRVSGGAPPRHVPAPWLAPGADLTPGMVWRLVEFYIFELMKTNLGENLLFLSFRGICLITYQRRFIPKAITVPNVPLNSASAAEMGNIKSSLLS